MKRTALFVVFALAIVFAAALVNVERASSRAVGGSIAGHDHEQDQHANHRSKGQGQEKQAVVDGANNPNAIPDSAAREIVMRLLTSSELNDRHKRDYLKAVGLNEGASAALLFAAHDFKRQSEGIEKEASDIKNRTWPNPDKATSDQLADLQRQKEAILLTVAADLDGRLRSFNALADWETHITNRVKRKTKVFQVGLPTKKVSFLQLFPKLFPDPFATYAQGPGCDPTVSIYSDTYESGFEVIGATSYSAPSNNCGHTFSPTTQIWGYSGGGGSGSMAAIVNLDMGDYFLDGLFHTNSDLDAFCPVVSQTYYAGNNASEMNKSAFVSLSPYTLCNTNGDVKVGVGLSCALSVTGSNDSAGKSVTISVGDQPVGSNGHYSMVNTSTSSSHTFSGPPNTSKKHTFAVTHNPTALFIEPAFFLGRTNIGSATLTVYNSPQVTTERKIIK